MKPIDHAHFFAAYEAAFKPLSDSQRDGLGFLLACLEGDDLVTDIRWAAYMLATTKWECGDTWRPIEEVGKGKGHSYGEPVNGHVYFGRGFCQLSWAGNYSNMGNVLHVDLLRRPELALDPPVAYRIMSVGMRNGMFTGVGLGRFINDHLCDYVGARKIINGIDQAERIAGFATKLEACLHASAPELTDFDRATILSSLDIAADIDVSPQHDDIATADTEPPAKS